MENIRVKRESPNQPEVLFLIEKLDVYLCSLYPKESNHLLNASELLAPSVRFFVARDGALAVGCGAVRMEVGYAEIKRMYVLPSMRGRRIGKRLLEAAEECARREGVTCLRLEAGRSQPEALALYLAMGYAECGPFGSYAPDPLSVFMEKMLS